MIGLPRGGGFALLLAPGHGFLNDHESALDRIPLLVVLIGKLVANGYHEPSALDSRRRIVSFFDQHLKA